MAVISVKLLGGFEVALARGSVASLPTKKAQALLSELGMTRWLPHASAFAR